MKLLEAIPAPGLPGSEHCGPSITHPIGCEEENGVLWENQVHSKDLVKASAGVGAGLGGAMPVSVRHLEEFPSLP
ncbi:unnamed protein product [Boreogadus saida]